MFRTILRAALAAVTVTRAACGGGSNTGVDVTGGNACSGGGGGGVATPRASELVLVLSAQSVTNDGSQTVVASVTAVDGNRNAVAGVPVTISVNNGGVATTNGTTTDTSGVLNATIGIGSDRSERTITVTATSGSLTRTAALQVTATGGSVIEPSDLILTLSSPTIVNTGAERVTATVIALDAKRNVLPNTGVTVTVDNGAVAAPAGTVTDANGVLTAQVGIGGSSANRTITVTATAGALTRTATLAVTDTPIAVGPTAADLSLTLSASTLNNGGTSTILATATAVDSNRNALAQIPVTIKVDASAVAAVSSPVTNAQGVVTANVGIGSDRSNRVVTVTATSGGLTRSASFSVIGASLTAALSPLVETGSVGNAIEYTLVDTNRNPMPSQQISVTAPGLPPQSGVTNLNGKFVYTYAAPASTGTLAVTATAAGDSRTDTISVQAPGGSVPPATSVPQSASLTPSPSVVSVNTLGSSANQVELRALFIGANNQPIPNVRVRFDLENNENNSDGVVSWLGGTYAYSDVSGVARGTFTAGQRSSPTNGVKLRACYSTTDFAVGTCPNAVTSTITVTSEALAVNIRTNELVKSGAAQLTYIKEFVVMVVDSAGQAKPDVQITPSVDLPSYYKGFYEWNGDRWVRSEVLVDEVFGSLSSVCLNEDANRNGIREDGEDYNGNGELDPRKSDVAVKMVGSSRTDANGLAIVQIEYGRDLATWVDFEITVTASGISGTEARARYAGLLAGVGNLPAPGNAFTNEDVAPAFVISPYGRSANCADPN